MNKRILDNKALDMIGRKLIERGSVPSNNIDKIVSNPQLFDLVRKRIAADAETPAGASFLHFIRRNGIAAASIGLIVIAVMTAASLLRLENTVFTVGESQVPEAFPEVARPVIPPQGTVTKLATGRAFDREIQFEKASVKLGSKREDRNRQRQAGHEPEGEFYALSFTGDPDAAAGGGRIIRVDLNRSSLFALGVNLPLENDAETVKADLLVGSDGVTRAIRVVN